MRITLPGLCLFALMAVIIASPSHAVPSVISYQGKLMQPSGAPLADGTVSLTFSVYESPVGGTPLWTETNTAVRIKDGLFSVLLGSVNPLPSALFTSAERYFGIKVGNDPETTPRQKVASVAFAQVAGTADAANTAKVAENGVPVGGVIMWSGAANAIPAGWSLCDGANGTPDLRDRFVVGSGGAFMSGNKGGLPSVNLTHSHGTGDHVLSAAQMPAHSHGVHDPGHGHGVGVAIGWGTAGPNPGWGRLDTNGGHSGQGWAAWANASATGVSIQNSGGNAAHNHGSTANALGSTDIRPPYYALAFIMKTSN